MRIMLTKMHVDRGHVKHLTLDARLQKSSTGMRNSPREVVIPIVAVLTVAVLGGILGTRQQAHPAAPSAEIATEATTESTPVTAHAPDGFKLTLRRDGKMLRVLWDRQSPAVREASEAELYITDGNPKSKLKLSDAAIRSGMLSYWPENQNVAFRLDLVAAHQTVSGSVETSDAPAP